MFDDQYKDIDVWIVILVNRHDLFIDQFFDTSVIYLDYLDSPNQPRGIDIDQFWTPITWLEIGGF